MLVYWWWVLRKEDQKFYRYQTMALGRIQSKQLQNYGHCQKKGVGVRKKQFTQHYDSKSKCHCHKISYVKGSLQKCKMS